MRVFLMILLTLTSGCSFTSKMLDLQHHRNEYIDARPSIAPNVAADIRAKRISVGMTLEEARVAWDVGTTWYRLGNQWVVGKQLIITVGTGGKIVRISEYGYR